MSYPPDNRSLLFLLPFGGRGLSSLLFWFFVLRSASPVYFLGGPKLSIHLLPLRRVWPPPEQRHFSSCQWVSCGFEASGRLPLAHLSRSQNALGEILCAVSLPPSSQGKSGFGWRQCILVSLHRVRENYE